MVGCYKINIFEEKADKLKKIFQTKVVAHEIMRKKYLNIFSLALVDNPLANFKIFHPVGKTGDSRRPCVRIELSTPLLTLLI